MAGFQLTTLPQQLINGLMLGAIYALIALGYTMVYGVLKLINFAHGEVFMLGAYGALLASWWMGYGPNGQAQQGSWLVLAIMLLTAMATSGGFGLLIERFAYRPIRNYPRIASLITAIGLSLLFQYGGQIFLLDGKFQAIDGKVMPASMQEDVAFDLKGKNTALLEEAKKLKPEFEKASAAFNEQLKSETSRFQLSPKGTELRDARDKIDRKIKDLENEANNGAISIRIPKAKILMFGTTLVLMVALTYLVMFTKPGRAMRAVSLDFNAASLMGINVNKIVALTFFIGSVLAGAGAMMWATFISGNKIDTFMGMAPGVKAFVAAVLGGIGNIPGAVLGGLLMGVSENLVDWAGYDGYRDAIAFVILILVLLVKPGGLLGSNKVDKV